MVPRGLRLFLWLLLVHIVGVYLFTKGFLLNRLALHNRASCLEEPCAQLATHKRAVVVIIDALRFDFISNHPPQPSSPHHHHILTLPRELTAAHPHHSFIFNAYADPPTTTLQRIKGLTTGSLPTFVDIGESFGGSAIVEDSLLHQIDHTGRKVVFVGDDTWLSLFPTFLGHNMSYPFDSFDVEDLHTVDEGVIAHLRSLIQQNPDDWGLAIGHGLGVDHAGHRVGPDHPVMKAKLQQMNDFLTDLVRVIDEDTLLVVLGDHGMDHAGNHGGDSVLETSSAVWIYSKGAPLSGSLTPLPADITPYTTFPGAPIPHRFIQQIDLLPTISLLLGLPIPFNNLGSIIPELFHRSVDGSGLTTALELNADQIKRYLHAYRESTSGQELDAAWPTLLAGWLDSQGAPADTPFSTLVAFNRLALSTCRSLWAQFSLTLIGIGLTVILLSIIASYSTYTFLANSAERWEETLDNDLRMCLQFGAAGLVAGALVHPILRKYVEGVHFHHVVIFAGAVASSLPLILASRPKINTDTLKTVPIPLILHALCFTSNSFTIWEDHIVGFLCVTSLVPQVLIGFTAPTSRLRCRILGFSVLFAVCVRLMMLSTVCREEQRPFCTVTFYSSSTSSASPVISLVLAPISAGAAPHFVRRILSVSKSDRGLAGIFLPWTFSLALFTGTAFWLLERIHSAEYLGNEINGWLRFLRTALATITMIIMVFGGVTFWWMMPVCLDIRREADEGPVSSGHPTPSQSSTKNQVTVLGFANAFGSPYLVFWSIFLSLTWLCTQLTGQIVLGLATVALLAHLELVDSIRDVQSLNHALSSAKPSNALDHATRREVSFSEIAPIALLAVHTFHGTGHQPTIPSLQWKTAFILTPTVSFPYSQLTVFLNTLGPHFLAGLASPLLALWNLPPSPPPRGLMPSVLRAGLGVALYFSVLLLASAACAAGFRRHLMVWKIFAPRYMFAALSVIAIDVGVLVGIAIGVYRVRERIGKIFRAVAA
ncbi:hypothetical protein SCLCIDRAFT_1217073 [Scleroderma citrinum Foug A]|uniref:Uncharacterized protein n=1 Tax=Scleroderma citrinum Foug A TaxID=1036808 RepID=A0A0C3DVQ2_9AGAM|nr:hypothetical protein SCLCIDRAFT_1217073 [Scleroderma citrinum Foug A]